MAFPSLQLNSFLIISVFLFYSAYPAAGQSECNVLSGWSISTGDATPWSSPSGEFAFGFRPLQHSPYANEDLFLLAIWFSKIPEQTIVWSVNDHEVPGGSKAQLTNEGQFVLYDPQGKEIWRAQTNNDGRANCAAMLDSGNFVLINGDSKYIWESFKVPTDTILPGQNISMGGRLSSSQSPTNYTKGRFQLSMQEDGNLVLYTVFLPSQDVISAYWATGTVRRNPDAELVFNEAGLIYLRQGTENIQNITKGKFRPTQDSYHMARIDYDGVFRQYNHPKWNYATAGSCPSAWNITQNTPEDICSAVINDLGSGACGFNSYCKNSNGMPKCFCPPGYSLVDRLDQSKGCKPDFHLPSCQQNGMDFNTDSFELKELNETDWPLADYEHQTGPLITKDTCKDLCLMDCFCAAAIYTGGNCWKKKYPLSNGRNSRGLNRTALIKVSKYNNTDSCQNKKGNQSTLVLVVSLLLGGSAFLNFLLLVIIAAVVYFLHYNKILNLPPNTATSVLRRYTYKELEQATGGFKQQLGKGSFGTVYKGVTPTNPKRYIAVKKLKKVEAESEKEFTTEVNAIGRTHHKNLVTLLGYCDEGENRLLVYECMSNGSLAGFLFGLSRPHWNQRVQIVCGIARGLTYLHEECSTQIIHCDIKPQNILLDEFLTPKIADFGLAKLLLAEQSRAARTNIRGTVGYFAPEWFRKASITVKVDVYSFGVMLLEIICCTSSVKFAMGEEGKALIDWAYDCYSRKKVNKMVENDEEARNDMKNVERLVKIAIWCIQEDPSTRPSMKRITQMLEGVADVPVPPRPSVFSSS